MIIRNALAAGVLALAVASPSLAKKDAPLTGLALQQIQARDFETTLDMLFPSIVTVLQDSGYRITEADRTSGFISGVGSVEQKTTFNIWYGLGKKKEVPMVSVFVEQRGPSISRARLNFVLSKAKSRNSFTDEKPLTDPAVYKDAFERIEKELFVRVAMNAPKATPAPVAAVAPAAPPAPAPVAASGPTDGAGQLR